MTDGDESEEVESIREQKAEELRSQLTSPDEPVHVEDRNHLAELVADGSPVLVDFYADWCGPCKMIEPTVESIAADTDATVAKVDVDEHTDVAGEFGVQSVPTLLLFDDGEPVEQVVGAQDEASLRSLVDSYV